MTGPPQGVQVGLLTKAVAASPMALPCHTTHGPARAAEVPAARSQPSLAWQRS